MIVIFSTCGLIIAETKGLSQFLHRLFSVPVPTIQGEIVGISLVPDSPKSLLSSGISIIPVIL